VKLRDSVRTCIDCGAWEVWGTDFLTGKLRMEGSRACTCPAPVVLAAPVGDGVTCCRDCGSPLGDERKERCPPCKRAYNLEYMRKWREGKTLTGTCVDCKGPCWEKAERCVACGQAYQKAERNRAHKERGQTWHIRRNEERRKRREARAKRHCEVCGKGPLDHMLSKYCRECKQERSRIDALRRSQAKGLGVEKVSQ
jgi:hypothetical protein